MTLLMLTDIFAAQMHRLEAFPISTSLAPQRRHAQPAF